MSNSIILWALMLVPWLTLFFMKKDDVKRFLPVGLFSSLTSVIIVEIGISLNWWNVNESAWPIRSVSYLFGLNPIISMWMMKFLHKKFWVYLAVDCIFNIVFAYVFLGLFLQWRGIYIFTGTSPLFTVFLTTVHGILLYGYQKWQESIFQHLSEARK